MIFHGGDDNNNNYYYYYYYYYRQTTESCHPIVPGGESARDKKIDSSRVENMKHLSRDPSKVRNNGRL